MKRELDRQILSKFQRLPGAIPSSFLGLEAIDGTLEGFGFEDDLNVKEEKSFKDLGVNEQLAVACENLGWKNPTKIQIEAIPYSLEGKDVIGLAQTGSGKTGAFARFLKTRRPSLLVSSRPHVNSRFKLLSSSRLWGRVLVSSVQCL